MTMVPFGNVTSWIATSFCDRWLNLTRNSTSSCTCTSTGASVMWKNRSPSRSMQLIVTTFTHNQSPSHPILPIHPTCNFLPHT